jgi:hypothetical protein
MKIKIKYLAALVVLASSYSAVAEEEKEKHGKQTVS